MQRLEVWTQQLVDDPELAEKQWSDLTFTMSLTSGTSLKTTEVMLDSPGEKNDHGFLQMSQLRNEQKQKGSSLGTNIFD